MSSKNRTRIFCCEQCAFESAKWFGRCPECGSWGSMVEKKTTPLDKVKPRLSAERPEPVSIVDVSIQRESRISTRICELDRVLGGGIVPASLVLVSGDPGIGKSTLLLQVLSNVCETGHPVIYLSGEESAQQIKIRADRLQIFQESLLLLSETSLERLLHVIDEYRPALLVVDSIQTIYTETVGSPPGSVSQIRECASMLLYTAKTMGTAILLAGHVTKDGMIAGPKALEHLVDAALYFEGNTGHSFRILRCVKNRFGATNEIGVFEMTDRGLKEVKNPSSLFISERPIDTPGSVVVGSMEGTRPLLVEIQTLITPTNYPQPRRMTIGIDTNRLVLLIAILEKKLGLSFSDRDVFVNVAGGVKLVEPATDLPLIMALVSCFLDKPLPYDLVVFGEVGLVGEVRAINQPQQRIQEATKLGFKKIIMPRASVPNACPVPKVRILGVSNIKEALQCSRSLGL